MLNASNTSNNDTDVPIYRNRLFRTADTAASLNLRLNLYRQIQAPDSTCISAILSTPRGGSQDHEGPYLFWSYNRLLADRVLRHSDRS